MNEILGTLLRIVEFIIALGVLISLHEFGHYLMAKLFHIEVEEFGIGFPPRLIKLFQLRETTFSLNWIPFGAFVRPKGENDPSVPGGLGAANPWVRLMVLLGGPLMNLLTGVVLFSLVFAQIGAPDMTKVLIVDTSKGSPAEAAGIKANDILLKINGITITSTDQLSTLVHDNQGKEITLTLLRDGKTVETRATPRLNPPQGQGSLGITMSNPLVKMTWLQSIPYSVDLTYQQGVQLIKLPGMMIRGQVSPQEGRFVGPKGIYDIFSAAQSRDQQEATATNQPASPLGLNTLGILATISVALGYTNLLPIPALDGGRILFVLPEILLRRRIPPEYENTINFIGFTALLLLMIYVTAQDFINPVVIP